MIDLITGFFTEATGLFIEMAPYLLLGFTVAGMLNALLSRGFIRRHVGGRGFGAITRAAAFGVPLPLCSCAVVPAAVSLKRSGASTPATLSFLIATPQTGVDSIVATYGLLGPLFAVFRPIAALVAGIFGGAVSRVVEDRAARTTMETEAAQTGADGAGSTTPAAAEAVRFAPAERWNRFWRHAYVDSVESIAGNFVVGLLIAAAIGLLIPEDFFEGRVIGSGLAAMLLMIAVGVPMYICATSSIPIALALLAKGLDPGAAYVFLFAGPATNAATIAVLVGILGRRQTVAFVASVIASSLAFGALLNVVAERVGWVAPSPAGGTANHAEGATRLDYLLAGALAVLIVAAFVRIIRRRIQARRSTAETVSAAEPVAEYRVRGMTCDCCVRSVNEAVRDVVGVTGVVVDLRSDRVLVHGAANDGDVTTAIRAAGYEVER